MNINPNHGESRKENQMSTLIRAASVTMLVTLGLTLGAWAAEPPKSEPAGSVNLALGCPVAVKTPNKGTPQGKGGFAAADLFKEKFADKAAGIAGWGSIATPQLYVNPRAEELNLLHGNNQTRIPARSVVVHPGPDTDVVVGWQSPIAATVSVRAKIAHVSSGSDGVTWAIKHGTSVLARGHAGSVQVPAAQGKDADKLAAVPVAKGDTISLVIGRNGNHHGDTTAIEFGLTEVTGEKRVWDLAKDVVADIQAANPHADALGNAGVWHFLAPKAAAPAGGEDTLAFYTWSPEQLTDGVRVVGGYSSDPVYDRPAIDEWVEIDLGAERFFHEIRMYPVRAYTRNGEGAPSFPLDYTIQTKTAGGQYATIKTVTNQANPGIAPVVLPVPNQKARFVKIAVSRVSEPPPNDPTYALRLAEVEVLGASVRAPQKAAATPPQQHWRLQTEDTAMTVAVVDNQPAVFELKNPRAGWNWLATPAVIPLPTRVQVHNVKDHTAATWAFQEATEDAANGKKVTLRFSCNEEPKVQMKFSWWAAKGPGPIQYQEVVENGTGKRVELWPRRDLLNLKPEREVVLWRFVTDSGAGAVPKSLFIDRLADGALHQAPIGGHSGFVAFVALDSGDHGVYFAGEWERGVIRTEASGSCPVTVGVKLPAGDHTDVPGTQAQLPFVYLGAYAGDMDDCGNGFKRWFFLHKVPENMRKDPTEPWTLYGGMWSTGGGWSSKEEVFVKGMKEKLSDIGIEEVGIDNGWWGKNGPASWKADPQLWPSGMEIAGKTARENGFKFSLYFLLRGEGATVKRLHETMTAYGVDTYRSDMGAPSVDFLDELAAIHPNFRYEFCDDGGKRMDYAMLQRATTIFVLDRYDPLNLRAAMYAKSYVIHPAQFLIPLETVEAVGKSKETMRYVLRTTMPGQFTMGLSGRGGYVLPSDHPPIIEVAKESIALYKTRIRPLIREGNLYHVFLRPNGTDWDGVQLHDPAKGKGAVLLFKPNNKVDTRRIVLKGLDRTRTYALTFQDRPEQSTRKTGADLMDQGFDVTMTGQNVSEIVWVEESR